MWSGLQKKIKYLNHVKINLNLCLVWKLYSYKLLSWVLKFCEGSISKANTQKKEKEKAKDMKLLQMVISDDSINSLSFYLILLHVDSPYEKEQHIV